MVERVNRLSVYVEELQADKARQQKQITDLTREVGRLHEQLERASSGVSREDVQALANAVSQLERKQREDMKSVANEIEKLGKASAAAARASNPAPSPRAALSGWDHTIASGDTLSAIAQAYQKAYGTKATPDDILKANPGLKATSLQIGQVIIVPDK